MSLIMSQGTSVAKEVSGVILKVTGVVLRHYKGLAGSTSGSSEGSRCHLNFSKDFNDYWGH